MMPRFCRKLSILMAYSRGITYRMDTATLREENIIFMALSRDIRPHFTTIAGFISKFPMEMEDLFATVTCPAEKRCLRSENQKEPRTSEYSPSLVIQEFLLHIKSIVYIMKYKLKI
ncbi:MAG: hypothetical protein MJE63_11725 [Proteobacteria bacterium]|nr:hypothetical protein [Pseudomonadota bacterium]